MPGGGFARFPLDRILTVSPASKDSLPDGQAPQKEPSRDKVAGCQQIGHDASIMETLEVRTQHREQFVEITANVQRLVAASGLHRGVAVVYVPHTTAGVTINENADPDVVHDMLLTLRRLVPKDAPGYRHAEGNSDSHVKGALMGSSCHVLVEEKQLVLGRWQGIYFCEFDGPRTRQVYVQTIPSP